MTSRVNEVQPRLPLFSTATDTTAAAICTGQACHRPPARMIDAQHAASRARSQPSVHAASQARMHAASTTHACVSTHVSTHERLTMTSDTQSK